MPQPKKHKAQRTRNKAFVPSKNKSLSFVHCSLSRNLVGIGIDLLSLDRARDLLKRHGNFFFKRILSPQELKKKPVCSALQLAKYFTAKEAFFKSSDLNWTDLRGFSGMWISRMRGNQFEMECSDPSLHGSGTFFKRGKVWGAQVQTWSSFILPLNLRFNRHRTASRGFKVKEKD